MARKRRSHTREFKVEAAKFVTAKGYSVAEAARSLDVGEPLLRSGKQTLERTGAPAFPGHGKRPAGRVSVINGKIFRYAQNSVPYYGMDVRAFEVDELTAASYREREVSRSPILKGSGSGWNGCGMHHLDAHFLRDGSWVACVDGWTHDAVLQALQSRNGQVG